MTDYRFDPNSDFTEEDKKRILAIKRAFDAVDLHFNLADYKVKINPSTYSVFEDMTGEKYEDVLQKVITIASEKANNMADVIKKLHDMANEEYEPCDEGDVPILLYSLIDIIMTNYIASSSEA